MSTSKLHAIADAADALARLAREIADDEGRSDTLLTLEQAARAAATTRRVLREAIRAGELQAYGRARDRAVRRADLEFWIANRRMPVEQGADDADMERRVERLARARRRANSRRSPRTSSGGP